MGLKLAKILYRIIQHVHTTLKISTSFIFQHIPGEMLFLLKKRSKIYIILVCKLYIYRAIDLKTWHACGEPPSLTAITTVCF